MKQKDTDSTQTERTKCLAEELGKHPHLRDRVEAILHLVRGDDGPIGKADDVEERLVTEVRKLGKNAMQEWALNAEERSAAELRRDSPTARCLEKGLTWVVRLRTGLRPGARLADADGEVFARVQRNAPERRVRPRQ